MDSSSTKRKQRVVIWESFSSISGGQRVALNIAECLRERFDLKFIVPSSGQLSSALNGMDIDVVYIPTGNYQRGRKGFRDIVNYLWLTPSILWRSLKHIRGSDLIYANSTKVFVWSAIVGSFLNVPVIWHLHNLLIDSKSLMLLRVFSRLASVRKIIAVSHAAANHFGGHQDKSVIIYNGVNIDTFQARHSPRNTPVRRIGVIADLLPQKGHPAVIRAVHRIRDRLPIELLIIGASIDGGSYENELKGMVRQLQLEDIITFTGYRTDIPELLNSLDLVVIPSSSYEACPMVALEAFAAGVPVIGSDLGGTPELIDDGRTGYVFRPDDDGDLAEKIMRILNDPALHRSMRLDCRKQAEEKYNLHVCGKEIESLLWKTLQTSQ